MLFQGSTIIMNASKVCKGWINYIIKRTHFFFGSQIFHHLLWIFQNFLFAETWALIYLVAKASIDFMFSPCLSSISSLLIRLFSSFSLIFIFSVRCSIKSVKTPIFRIVQGYSLSSHSLFPHHCSKLKFTAIHVVWIKKNFVMKFL